MSPFPRGKRPSNRINQGEIKDTSGERHQNLKNLQKKLNFIVFQPTPII